MCKYCNAEDYVGEKFKFEKDIGVSRENLEVYLLDSPEDECMVININSNNLDVRIKIRYCPFCGVMV